MQADRRSFLAAAAALLATTKAGTAQAQGQAPAPSRAETLRYITGNTVNTLDPSTPGATRESFGLSIATYDRLFTFGRKKLGSDWVFDAKTIRGELAKSYAVSDDGLKITITLRPDALWHDGTPVTAEDIKWSLDRAVSAKSLAPPQLSTGSLTSPDQFKVTSPQTVEVTLPQPDRLAVSNLCVPYAIMVNSKLARAHATAEDPWAMDWLKSNPAGGGAYIVDTFKPGEAITLRRNDAWKSGEDSKLPFFRRIIVQTVPEPATRANLLERGDADLAIDLAASDLPTMEKSSKVKVVSVPQTNGFTHVSMNTQMAPFDNVKVRQAIAAALPYEDMFKAALFGRGAKLYGATWTTPPNADFPQPMPNTTDLDRAKALLTEAGMPDGFKTTFAISAGQAATAEPAAALLKESLGKIGITVDIQKKPDAEFNTLESDKKLPFFLDGATAWLPYTDYYFRLYFTRDQRWNFASWKNRDIEDIANAARFETNTGKYDADCKDMIGIFAKQVPLLMLWQPNHDAVMAANIDGYTYEFYRQADFRDLKRS